MQELKRIEKKIILNLLILICVYRIIHLVVYFQLGLLFSIEDNKLNE